MTDPRERFPAAVLLPVVVGALVGTAVPGAPSWTVAVLFLVLLVRRGILLRAPEWTGGEGWLAAWILTPVALAAGVAAGLHQGMSAPAVIVGAATLLLSVSACAPPTALGLIRLVGLSAVSVAVAAALVPTGTVVLGVTGYVVALTLALLDLERRRASPFSSGSQVSLRHVRARTDDAPKARRVGRQALRLAAVALPLALWLFVTLPTKPDTSDALGADGRSGPSSARPTEDGLERRAGGSGIPALDAFVSGARTKMRLDFVRRVQGDQRPVLLVRVGDGEDPGTDLLLRGMAYDRLGEDVRGVIAWTRSPAVTSGARAVSPDPSEGDWLWLGLAPGGRVPMRHVVRDLQGHLGGQLFLPPSPSRVRFDAELDDPRLRVFTDGTVLALGRIPAGHGYEVDAPGPGRARRPDPTARSDAAVAPDATYVASPPDAAELRTIARRVVGDATAPSDRAERIERWLRTFTYSTDMPELDPRRPLADFLTRVRAGHCEWFASGMAAMLRCLGHPTRLVVGFRGGDFLETIRWVSFRGNHAHAWCEVWFEGHGWVPYDPTPAAARETATGLEPAGGSGPTGGEDGEGSAAARGSGPFLSRLLRFSREDRRSLAGDAGRAMSDLRRDLERTLERLVPGAGRFALPLLALLVVVVVLYVRSRRRRAAALASLGTPARASLALGPYRRALASLESIGLRRRAAHTPIEHAERVETGLPPGAPALWALTSLHDRVRYGEQTPDEDELAAAETAADQVEAAVRVRRDGSPGTSRSTGEKTPPLPGGSTPG